MSLSVCLLTRNEASNLDRVIRSVAGLADEVIVVDTGSTDETVLRGWELGARVSSFAWDDDFSAGRNSALDQATGDWILWLNPDEEVPEAGHAILKGCQTRTDVLGYYLLVQDQLQANQPNRVTETWQFRLFRRRPDLRFLGRLHPRFEPPAEEVAARAGLVLDRAPVVIRRHAYLSALTEDKLRWAVRLLERELSDRPGQLPYLIEYGRTLLRLNDPRGHEVLAQAADQVLQVRDAARPPTAQLGQLLEYLMTVSPHLARGRLSREEARTLALRWFPQSPPMLWRVAEYDFQRGAFQEAAALLERLVQCAQTGVYDRAQSFEPNILGAPAVMNLGICYTRLGQLDRAEQCFRALLNAPGHEAAAASNLRLVQQLRQRTQIPPATSS